MTQQIAVDAEDSVRRPCRLFLTFRCGVVEAEDDRNDDPVGLRFYGLCPHLGPRGDVGQLRGRCSVIPGDDAQSRKQISYLAVIKCHW